MLHHEGFCDLYPSKILQRRQNQEVRGDEGTY